MNPETANNQTVEASNSNSNNRLKFCIHCGVELKKDSKFCASC